MNVGRINQNKSVEVHVMTYDDTGVAADVLSADTEEAAVAGYQ